MKGIRIARTAAALLIVSIIFLAAQLIPGSVTAQSGRKSQPDQQQSPPQPQAGSSQRGQPPLSSTKPEEVGEDGTLKVDTTLVSIPVTVLDREGRYVPFMRKEDFRIFEDGVAQEIESFKSVETPFNVALLLDTSRSTKFKMEEIQRAAVEFIELLRPDDRVMVSSFDSKVYIDCEFTNDRRKLRRAIYNTRTGGSTRLYDAVDLAITERLDRIEGRKAIVLFTDGVDTDSREASYQSTIDLVEESGVLVYPIKYNTEDDLGYGGGMPGGRGGRGRGPWGGPPTFPGPRWPGQRGPGNGSDDYRTAGRYLQMLAERSAGRLYHADTLDNLSRAFTQIAEELRYQYALSYYPTNAANDGTYRRIKVQANQPNLVVRAREGYRAKGGTQSNKGKDERPTLRHINP
ncbi:MAG TPA: VWA domain-containing protein [Blastocatellia bacterium]|nr:VWA domain-containing protein [Blastocatellia bacterium]